MSIFLIKISNTENAFGANPETTLKKDVHKIAQNRKVLDPGIGLGRNSFYLAKKRTPN